MFGLIVIGRDVNGENYYLNKLYRWILFSGSEELFSFKDGHCPALLIVQNPESFMEELWNDFGTVCKTRDTVTSFPLLLPKELIGFLEANEEAA